MRRLFRDPLRSMLVFLLITCAFVISSLGAMVHLFTLRETKAVEDSIVTLAVRHAGTYETDSDGYSYSNFYSSRDVSLLNTINQFESVKVPALTAAYAGVDASVVPVYSADYAGNPPYAWGYDRDISYQVLTVTCLEHIGGGSTFTDASGKTTVSGNWYSLVHVDEAHLSLPYEIPEVIRVQGRSTENLASGPQEPLIPGETYVLCGMYTHYPSELNMSASLIKGYYDPVYTQDKSEPPLLYLNSWWELDAYMKYISTPEDTRWLQEAVSMADKNNRRLRLDTINDLNRIRWFQNGTASIVQGRSFTRAELDQGAKVCLISRDLAKKNGLSVGDTITMTAHQPTIHLTVLPKADGVDEYYQFTNLVYLSEDSYYNPRGETVTYEIIGLYAAPLYKNTNDSFSPNTVFAPYGSVSLEANFLLRRLPIHAQNLIIQNGQGDAFLEDVKNAGYPDGIYTIEETTYPQVRKVLAAMSGDSLALLIISASVGLIMMIVALALYARGWRKENAVLSMLGAGRFRIFFRMLASLVLLTLSGCLAASGVMLWTRAYIENALSSIYIGASMDFSAIHVGAFSENGITIATETIFTAFLLTAAAFMAAVVLQSILSAGKKVRKCLYD